MEDKAALTQYDQLSAAQPKNDPSLAEPQNIMPTAIAPPAYQANPQPHPPQPQPVHQEPPGYRTQPYQQQYPSQYYAQPTTNVVMVTSAPAVQPVEHVDDNMVISIVSLFFCCILGIFAIIKAQEAREHKLRGNYVMAQMAAKTAKTFAIIGIVIGCLGVIIGVVVGAIFPYVVWASYSYESSDFDY